MVENPDNPYQVAKFFINAFLADARDLQMAVVPDYDAAPGPNDQAQHHAPPHPAHPPVHRHDSATHRQGPRLLGADGVVYYDVHSFPAYGKLSGNSLDQLSHNNRGRTNNLPPKTTPPTSSSGNPTAPTSCAGPAPGAKATPAGISMFRHGHQHPGTDHRPPHRRRRQHLPPPRVRDRPDRRHHRPTLARFWLHARHLMVDGEKMSKSKGTFFTIRDLAAKATTPSSSAWPSSTFPPIGVRRVPFLARLDRLADQRGERLPFDAGARLQPAGRVHQGFRVNHPLPLSVVSNLGLPGYRVTGARRSSRTPLLSCPRSDRAMDDTRLLIRQFLAALAYRTQKTLQTPPQTLPRSGTLRRSARRTSWSAI